ncbi:hypothetical protein [Nocardioides daphniae]|uniref:hypothetical protein n=1 Tax=Nocardioides daphniae TaxID=402297 RepID=UPI001EE7B877|nr:hypothetical protein [Nocardioides daphniae]
MRTGSGETGELGRSAASTGMIRSGAVPRPCGFWISSTVSASELTQASASSTARSGVLARAVICSRTVSGGWMASMLLTSEAGDSVRPRSSMTRSATARLRAIWRNEVAFDFARLSLTEASDVFSSVVDVVTKPFALAA